MLSTGLIVALLFIGGTHSSNYLCSTSYSHFRAFGIIHFIFQNRFQLQALFWTRTELQMVAQVYPLHFLMDKPILWPWVGTTAMPGINLLELRNAISLDTWKASLRLALPWPDVQDLMIWSSPSCLSTHLTPCSSGPKMAKFKLSKALSPTEKLKVTIYEEMRRMEIGPSASSVSNF